jgi:hypothetical protein
MEVPVEKSKESNEARLLHSFQRSLATALRLARFHRDMIGEIIESRAPDSDHSVKLKAALATCEESLSTVIVETAFLLASVRELDDAPSEEEIDEMMKNSAQSRDR